MKQRKNKGQTLGGSADALSTMSEYDLAMLMCDTHETLKKINPYTEAEYYDKYQRLFDLVAKTYYDRFVDNGMGV